MAEVSNPYRDAVHANREKSWSARHGMRVMLDETIGLFPMAWSGGSSEDVRQLLLRLQSDGAGAATAAYDEFTAEIGRQPEMVEEGSWQTRWRSM